jgi:hypothetical protein
LNDIGQAGAFAADSLRYLNPQQPMLFGGGDGGIRKTGVAIDGSGMLRCYGDHGLGTCIDAFDVQTRRGVMGVHIHGSPVLGLAPMCGRRRDASSTAI